MLKVKMARLIWREALIPQNEPVGDTVYDYFASPLKIERTQAIARGENDFDEIPDRKALRLMSRTSVLLSAVMMRAKEVLPELLGRDAFRVATYCAIDNGSESYPCVKGMVGVDKEQFAEKYRRLRSPKQYLKQLPNLAPAQAGIFLGLVGPLNVFHHSRFAGLHALQQMRADLRSGRIDAGLVVSANSFEDPLLTYRNRMDSDASKVLREGAGALLFVRGDDEGVDPSSLEFESDYDYGIATQIIELSLKGVQSHDT